MRSVLRAFELGVLLLTSASIAVAQTVPPAPAGEAPQVVPSAPLPAASAPASTPLPAAGDPKALEEARELFWQAHSHFEKGQYVEALPLFERTYALRPEPEVLFNLALTHQRLGHCNQARALYHEYQTRVQTDVTKQLGELDAQCSTAPEAPAKDSTKLVPPPFAITVVQPPEPQTGPDPPPAPAPVAADSGDSEPFPLKTLGWVAVGAAAVALGFAVYFEAERRQYRSDYDSAITGDEQDAIEPEYYRAQKRAVTMGVVSGVFAAGGVTLLVLAPSSPAPSEPEPGQKLGLGLRWSGSF